MRFNVLSSPYFTLLPPLFPIIGRTPFPPSHCSPARAIFLGSSRVPYPPADCSTTHAIFFTRPPESTSPLARRLPKPQSLSALKNPMAESTDTQSRDWNSLPDVLLEQICNRMDLLSTVRLAACSLSLYRLLVYNLSALFKTPCLLMADPHRWKDSDLTILWRLPWCPSTCYHYPSTCPSCAATSGWA